MVRGTDSLL